MKSNITKKLCRLLPFAALVAATLHAPVATAGGIVGFDPTGTGTYTVQTDLWTNNTDSALSVGFNPLASVDITNPASYYQTSLIAQARVGILNLGPTNVNPIGMNAINGSATATLLDTFAPTTPRFELTKVLNINENVIFQQGFNVQFDGNVAQPDIDASTLGAQQLMIYYDNIKDGTQAVPGDGSGTVKCYGPTGGTINACPANDGLLILSAHLVKATSSFAANPDGSNVGTGSFNLQFVIDYSNTNYLDLATGGILGDTLTGTINIPSQFTPAKMWDGTATNTGLLLKVDSSESFIPEPGSLALVGLALTGLGLSRRRKAK